MEIWRWRKMKLTLKATLKFFFYRQILVVSMLPIFILLDLNLRPLTLSILILSWVIQSLKYIFYFFVVDRIVELKLNKKGLNIFSPCILRLFEE